MKSLFIFIIAYVCLSVCLSNVYGLQCNGSHEEIKCVQSCPPEKTCLNKDTLFKCNNQDEKACQLLCVCEDEYYRNIEGECVTIENCVPTCGLNEEYKWYMCPDTCISLVTQIQCGPSEPGCACREGYARQTADEPCRPIRECSELANSPDFN